MLLFLVTPCHVVAIQPCMEWIPIKQKTKKKKKNYSGAFLEVIYQPIKYTSKLGRKIIYVFVSTASSVPSVIENCHLKKNQNNFFFFFLDRKC